ncbi:MAG: VCBS repeat-containing protein [Acidobacteria bacterium]|nr:VCBS repeat-containing protein [Acidobacteriota bacterium]MBI3658216.1 VCBS repeat-containing protein [Acidobacteriota bacterium]
MIRGQSTRFRVQVCLFLLLFNLFTQYGFSGVWYPDGNPPDNSGGQDHGKKTTSCVGSEAELPDGNLTLDYVLPSYRSLNTSHTLRWVYNSITADVRPILPLDVSRPPGTPPPPTLSTRLLVNGTLRGEVFYSGPPDASSLTPYRMAMQFDANSMTTGVYPYTMQMFLNYSDTSRFSNATSDQLLINNQRSSPFGAGWGLAGLQRLYPPAPGSFSAVLTDGDGTAKVFSIEPADALPFKVTREFPAGSNPHTVATGDFNGDRILDLAVVNINSNNVSIFLGDRTGWFGPPTNYTVGNSPVGVAVGDFNRDGKLDLAVANSASTSNNLSILLGNGDGTFVERPSRPVVGTGPYMIAVGDFDRDNVPDLAVANSGSNTVSILLGIGTGDFKSIRNFNVGSVPTSIVVADFNGDGKLDLATSNIGSNNVSILLGDGSGGFSPPTQRRDVPVQGQAYGLVAGDFDKDGKIDLAVANAGPNTLSILYGNGNGEFRDADRMDVGTGGSGPRGISAADFNKDGNLDLIVSHSESNTVSILLGNGAGLRGFTSPPRVFSTGRTPLYLAVGDFYQDGNLDVAVPNYNSNSVSVLLGDGRGNFVNSARNFPVGNNPISVVAGDFNRDGNLDLAVANNGSNNVSILLGVGDGTFQFFRNFPVGNAPRYIVAGDFNRDGNLDLAVTNYYSNNVSILLGNGDGSFQPPRNFPVNQAHYLVTGDFNRDGKLDLAVTTYFGYEPYARIVSILLGNGDGTFRPGGNFPVGINPNDVVANDFNRDGNLDLVIANAGSNNVSILLGNGDGTFRPAANIPVGNNPVAVVARDFNRDGNLDLAVANSESNNVSILLGDGGGNFSAARNFPVGNNPWQVVAGDFNRDGNLDLAVANSGSNNVSILLGNDDGTFQSSGNFPVGNNPWSVAAGDFNRDGRPDLAVANRDSSNVSVFVSSRGAPDGEFSELVRNPDGTFTRTMKDGTQINFNAEGRQVSTVDRNGNITQYDYDDQGRLISITDPVGLVTTLEYVSPGLKVTDPAGRVTIFTIENGHLTQAVDPGGATARFAYDADHHLISRKDARDFTTQYEYNFAGRFAKSTFPMERPPAERIIKEVTASQPSGLVDPAGGRGTRLNPAQFGRDYFRTDQVYSGFKDCRGQTLYRTDRFGATTYSKDALNRETKIERDQNSSPTKITAPDGTVTTMTYDDKGNVLTSTVDSIAATTTSTYHPICNQVAGLRDPEGHVTTFTYDARCNRIETKDAAGTRTVMTYNSRGLLETITRAAGTPLENITRYTYDTLGNLIVTRDPLGNETRLGYDLAGNVVTSTDAEGRTTTYTYDALNRLTSVSDAADPPGVTTYTYLPGCCGNPTSLLESVTDANGQITRFEYDEMGHLKRSTNPLNQRKIFAYDCYGNLIETTDARQWRITYDYDAAHQLKSKTWISLTPPNPPTITFDYVYDRVGNLKKVAKKAGAVIESTLEMNYDGARRMIGVDTGGTLLPARSINYVYDKNGNHLRMTLVGTPPEVARYEYDVLSRLRQLTASQPPDDPKVFTFSYDALSRRTQLNFPNNTAASYTYDLADRLTSLIHRSVDPIAGFQYTYDRVGNRRTRTDLEGLNGFDYDNLNRLVHATHPQDFNPEESFDYDPVGNRLSSHLSATYVYDTANRLQQDDRFIYSYDANGNLTSKREIATSAITQFTYDSENQITRIDFPGGGFAEYKYDGLGRRIQKNVNGTLTRYIYDGANVLLELDGSNNIVARYTNGLGIDEPLIMNRAGQNYFYHADGLGSIAQLTDPSGGPARSYIYDAFGNIVDQTGDPMNPYSYTSREFDAESGLYYYRARYYDPQVGRFISEDLFGDMNLYAYVGNNPVRWLDPLGLDTTSWWGDGRHWWDGPKNGNWGGKKWSGGWNPNRHGGRNGPRKPTDSADECYKQHDECYDSCSKCSTERNECKSDCNWQLVACLMILDDDPRIWSKPPRTGTEDDSSRFRDWATRYFF